MKLTKEQIKQLQDALLSGYNEHTLRMMVRIEMGEDLAVVAGGDTLALRARVFNLIEWAEKCGRIFELIDGAKSQQDGNVDIERLWQTSQVWRQTTSVEPAAGKLACVEPVGSVHSEFDWVTVPAGLFWMGDKKERCGRRRDQIYVPEFRIARVPVTNAQYDKFLEETDHPAPEEWEFVSPDEQTHPVVGISWYDAMAFCTWAQVRLPSEAEWEKAARGTDGRKYPWGNRPPTRYQCNFDSERGPTIVVGSYPKGASPSGVLDMVGNVPEWTSSLYRQYPYDVNDGRENPKSRRERVVRGGSWEDWDNMTDCATRRSQQPESRDSLFGFRVVLLGI